MPRRPFLPRQPLSEKQPVSLRNGAWSSPLAVPVTYFRGWLSASHAGNRGSKPLRGATFFGQSAFFPNFSPISGFD
jgi:hypothetical protein